MKPSVPPKRAMPAGVELAVTGRAMVSALGLDVVTACAAARAGITRPSEFEHFSGGGGETDPGGVPLKVHAVPGLTHGFVGEMRLLRLLEGAFRDFKVQLPDAPWQGVRTGVFVSMPDPERIWTGAAAISDEELRARFEAEAKEQTPTPPLPVAQRLLTRALALADLALTPAVTGATTIGHAGVASACLDAAEQLGADQLDLAIIVGLDSLLDVPTLLWLKEQARLRTADRPAGIPPGEACAVLVLETSRRAKQRGARVLCTVAGIQLAPDERSILTAETSTGALHATLCDAVRRGRASANAQPWLLSDHNGEVARAMAWGNMLFHLAEQSAEYRDCTSWFPAASFGDTGAASGAVAMCMAAAAWERGYAPARQAVLCSTSDGFERAALLLEQAT